TRAIFPNHDFRIEFGADDRNRRFANGQLAENLLRDLDHPIEIAISAAHPAAAQNDRAADLEPGFYDMTVIGLDGVALEIVGAGAEIIRPCIDRARVANDGVDTAPQRRLQRFPRKTVSEGAARRDDTVNEVRHQAALHGPTAIR